jgi:predicted AAA+ superfamily ATPase
MILQLLEGIKTIIRDLQSIIEKLLFKNQVILIYGARQVGKTTLSKQIIDKYSKTKKHNILIVKSLLLNYFLKQQMKNLYVKQ